MILGGLLSQMIPVFQLDIQTLASIFWDILFLLEREKKGKEDLQ